MNLLPKNVGPFDRFFRLLVGLLIGGVGLYFQNWLGLIGLVLALTALRRSCPLYGLFGVSTCRLKTKPGARA